MWGRCQGAPARVVDRTDPSAGLFGPPHVRAPSVSELPGQLTTSVEREVDVPGGAERAQKRSRAARPEALPRGARTFGGPNRRVERSVRPLESVHWGTQAGGFRVQHSPNVPALGGTASSDVRIFPAQRASRSGPRRAPGGNTPPPCAFSLSALTPKGLLHQARLSLLIQQ